ncbi:MAG: hypothetical protein KGO96_14320 [Elusimicrobia bacterium]|nr:hypothetical protein [Elusimicrobiota bacterium]
MRENLNYFLEITGTMAFLLIVLTHGAQFASVVTSASALFNKTVTTLQGR